VADGVAEHVLEHRALGGRHGGGGVLGGGHGSNVKHV
jgi:hypothetical protein